MSSSGNPRLARPIEPPPQPKRRRSKLVTLLLSCCLFEAVFCACLLAALVLLGRHYLYNNKDWSPCNNNTTTNNNTGYHLSYGNHRESRAKRDIIRLSREVIPMHYDVTLKPHFDDGTFTGRVNITLEVNQARDLLMLNSLYLDINKVQLIKQKNGDEIPLNKAHLNVPSEMLEITPQETVAVGNYYLIIDYSGQTANKLVGFYQSSYTSKRQKRCFFGSNKPKMTTRKMATSKFEPTYARQAYPCFDEPNMKATFTVHLLKPRDESYIALSNMPVNGEPTDLGDEGIMVHFQESVKMSTYLSCFIVSDFDHSEPVEFGEGKELRVYATKEQLSKTLYARDVGKLVIDFFTDYFGIPFPLPKLDMAAIPDFVSGAMEHWGLVTYRETALLYSPDISSSQNKQRIAVVVAHELAHSWFGNLVTMDWWSDLWLNEGFATYISYKGVQYAEPEWQMLNQFLVDDLHPVLKLDATTASHPIVQTVQTPDEITAVFDTISYNKGASVLRMLESAVGELVFKNGVTKYLNDHILGNAVTQDLWNALQEITEDDIEISQIMDTWTRQMGYPVIDVTSNGDSYILKQRRYLTNPDAQDNARSEYDYKWTIPITYTTKTVKTPQLVWFKHTDDQIVISKPAADWVKFNHHQIGYYRVNYESQADWNSLIADVNDLDIADRAHLIEETFSLAQSGTISYNIPLDLAKKLIGELEYVPWRVLSSVLQQLDVYLADLDYYQEFRNFAKSIVANAYENLKWDEEPDDGHVTRRLRVTVLNLACLMGDDSCLAEAQELFNSWLGTRASLSQDLRSLIYTYGSRQASEEDWERFFTIFAEEKDASEKLKLMQGLTYTVHESKLRKLINIAETDDVVRSQDYFTLLAYISDNPVGNSIVWDYVRENWENLVRRFGLNERYLGRMIPSITYRFTKQLRLDEMKDFFTRNPEAGAGAAARVEALQTVENNIKWLKLNKDVVKDWLSNNSK